MSVNATIHLPTEVEAKSYNNVHWVSFSKDQNYIIVICANAEVAQATADAWNDAMGYSQADGEA